MGQEEALEALKQLRKVNSDWHNLKDITEKLKLMKCTSGQIKGLSTDLIKLANKRMIECRLNIILGNWNINKEYRAINIK
jgi:tyrosine-protein phosphatase YwqE